MPRGLDVSVPAAGKFHPQKKHKNKQRQEDVVIRTVVVSEDVSVFGFIPWRVVPSE